MRNGSLTDENLVFLTNLSEDDAIDHLYRTVAEGTANRIAKAEGEGKPMSFEDIGKTFVCSMHWMAIALEEREKWLSEHSEVEI